MARCGCSTSACSCLIEAGSGVTVSGGGTEGNPYIITAQASTFNVTDTATLDLTRTGSGTVVDPFIISGTVVGTADVQVFSASGTWTRPTGKLHTQVYAWGGGGGGGGGSRGAVGSNRGGGGGGGAGALVIQDFKTSDLTATVAVTIGAAGTAGAAATTNGTAGGDGGVGGSTLFAAFLTCLGGNPGSGGKINTVLPTLLGVFGVGTQPALVITTDAGLTVARGGAGGILYNGIGYSTTPIAGSDGARYGSGGGGGGGVSTSESQFGGAAGGPIPTLNLTGGAGAAAAGNGGNGNTRTGTILVPGTGGGGGGSRATGGVGGTGGTGGRSAGGGGGGASTDGNNSGAGGVGGAGFLIAVSW